MSIYKLLSQFSDSLSSWFVSSAKKLLKHKNESNEYEQALLRVVVLTFIVTYLILYFDGLTYLVPAAWGVCMFFAFALLFHIDQNPKFNHKRVVLAILFDVGATTFSMGISDEVGSLFISIYLWLIVGYGLRYGKKYLIITAVTSMAGYVFTVNTNSYWLAHPKFAFGLSITLIVVPIYAYVLTNKLKKATEKAESNSKAKSQFLSHISHEIRTPLNGIIGASELINVTDKENSENLAIIRSSAKHLTDLVSGVLDMAAIEQGTLKNNVGKFDLGVLINECMDIFSSTAKTKETNLLKEVAENIPKHFEGDFLHLKEVLINLIGNAVKFTDTGYVKLSVVKNDQIGNVIKLRFKITDTGIGMDAKALDTIFESFTQADDSIRYRYGGTGLGTTISKRLIESMGGKIGVTSSKGEGTTFWFDLPLVKVESNENVINNVVELENFNRLNNAGRGFRVLIADDSEINRMLLMKVLTNEGYVVDAVNDGEAALDALEENNYDLIILDNNMPKMGGLEAMKVYHALHETKAVGRKAPVFIFSADATVESRDKALEDGAAAYITKPIQLDVMKLEIYKALKDEQPTQSAAVLNYKAPKAKLHENFLDIERLDGLVGLFGSHKAVADLLNDYLIDVDKNFERLNQYIGDADYVEISEMGHSMAGCASNVGAVVLTDIFKKIESVNPTFSMKAIRNLFNEANEVLAETKKSYIVYIEQLQKRNSIT